ncbi:hypothetical protein AB0N24_11820 [Arthrobacter sp. NPDC093128]|uniref:hypothetical protein n=1 Tax=Arthrobacter sp. NPDC093128 TaxID=3154979 RepID=UPI003420006C
MPEVESYKQGTPCWADLSASDIEAAKELLVDEPGAPVWSELQTSDVQQAIRFYEAVTGCTTETASAGELSEYTNFVVDGKPVAVPGVGTLAVLTDPNGAAFSIMAAESAGTL